ASIDLQIYPIPRDYLAILAETESLQALAIVIDDIAFLVGAEVTRTGIAQRTVVTGNKKAIAVDGQVQAVLRVVYIALGEHLRNVVQNRTAALRVASSTQDGRGIHVGKLGAGALEAHGTGVGDVVTGDIQI